HDPHRGARARGHRGVGAPGRHLTADRATSHARFPNRFTVRSHAGRAGVISAREPCGMTVQQRDPADRQRTARVLAGASQAELADLWREWPDRPDVEYVRGPEQGLVMVQARAGGRGDRFHLGEATVTRATVAVRSG